LIIVFQKAIPAAQAIGAGRRVAAENDTGYHGGNDSVRRLGQSARERAGGSETWPETG
jgi:hypothetical protein